MDIEDHLLIDDFPIKDGEFQVFHVCLPDGNSKKSALHPRRAGWARSLATWHPTHGARAWPWACRCSAPAGSLMPSKETDTEKYVLVMDFHQIFDGKKPLLFEQDKSWKWMRSWDKRLHFLTSQSYQVNGHLNSSNILITFKINEFYQQRVFQCCAMIFQCSPMFCVPLWLVHRRPTKPWNDFDLLRVLQQIGAFGVLRAIRVQSEKHPQMQRWHPWPNTKLVISVEAISKYLSQCHSWNHKVLKSFNEGYVIICHHQFMKSGYRDIAKPTNLSMVHLSAGQLKNRAWSTTRTSTIVGIWRYAMQPTLEATVIMYWSEEFRSHDLREDIDGFGMTGDFQLANQRHPKVALLSSPLEKSGSWNFFRNRFKDFPGKKRHPQTAMHLMELEIVVCSDVGPRSISPSAAPDFCNFGALARQTQDKYPAWIWGKLWKSWITN